MPNLLLNAKSNLYQNLIFLFRCNDILATPTGGKLELKDGVHFRRKGE
jgi:hypothetical protein